MFGGVDLVRFSDCFRSGLLLREFGLVRFAWTFVWFDLDVGVSDEFEQGSCGCWNCGF